jgi:hypothetical protein
VDDLVARLLARDPEDRFPSARALARAIAPLVGERSLAETRMSSMLRSTGPLFGTGSGAPSKHADQRVA